MITEKNVDNVNNTKIYFIKDENEKQYLYMTTDSMLNKGEVKYNINNKILLTHRFKNEIKNDIFYGVKDNYPDVQFYLNYNDCCSQYSQDKFGLIELTEDNLSDYLHLIM